MEDSRALKRLRSQLFDDDDDEMDYLMVQSQLVQRESKFFRRRWDSDYLVDLAEKEGSFVSEYRVDPQGFDILVQLLEPALRRNTIMAKEWFNFWQSQLRIHIECTFGIFISRWGIFWKDLRFDTASVIAIVHACCRLHNFCVTRNLPILQSVHRSSVSEVDVDGVLADPEWTQVMPNEGGAGQWTRSSNTLREKLLQKVIDLDLRHDRSYVPET